MTDPLPLTPLDDRRAVGRFNPRLRRARISGAGQVNYPIRQNAPSRHRAGCGQSADKFTVRVEARRLAEESVYARIYSWHCFFLALFCEAFSR
jgi:hypothetical protein